MELGKTEREILSMSPGEFERFAAYFMIQDDEARKARARRGK